MTDSKESVGSRSDSGDSGAGDPRHCDFCGLPCSKGCVTMERDSTTYEFCSQACRDAMGESDRESTEYHGFRRVRTGVSGLDRFLPQGFPRNSFVLVSNDEGSRDDALLAELVWRALQRDEPAVVVTFTEPPVSVVARFLSLEWNVLPYFESGQLHLLDCFTYRVDDRDRMFDRMDEWNRHIWSVTDDATVTVRDPSDVSELQNKLDGCLGSLEMGDRGIVAIDSLTEFGTLVQPVQAYDFVKDIRADICKGRFVPIFAGATITNEEKTFPHDLGYAVDGIIDLQQDGSLVQDTLIKRARIRKMNGVLSIAEWTAYEFTAGTGLVAFDPAAEMGDTVDEREDTEDERGDAEDERGDTYEGGGREQSPRRSAAGEAEQADSGSERTGSGNKRNDSGNE